MLVISVRVLCRGVVMVMTDLAWMRTARYGAGRELSMGAGLRSVGMVVMVVVMVVVMLLLRHPLPPPRQHPLPIPRRRRNEAVKLRLIP